MEKDNDSIIIDDYYEEDNDNLYNTTIQNDYSDVKYEDFNKVNNIQDDEEDELDTKINKVRYSYYERHSIISIILKWFIRIGIIIAVILVAYYVSKGMFKDLFLYLLLLVGAFFFGFGFTALIDKVVDL